MHAWNRIKSHKKIKRINFSFHHLLSHSLVAALLFGCFVKHPILRINNLHETSLRFTSQDGNSKFDKLLETCSKISTYLTCLIFFSDWGLPILTLLFCLMINGVLPSHQINFGLKNRYFFECANPRAVTNEIEAVTFRANFLWKKVKNCAITSSSLELIKKRTKLWNC